MMLKTLVVLSAVAAFSAAPAFAADTPAAQSTAASGTNSGMANKDVGQGLKQDLTKAGFTDIRIMPEAFIVHAKNSSGDPVLMRVSPDAVTELTEVPGLPNHAANGTAPSNSSTSSTTHASK